MEAIAKYVFEAGMLKRVKRSGWWAEGIKDPETVAEHSFRTGVISLILAKMEGLDDDSANRLCAAGLFHDMLEARIGDMNKITARYVTVKESLEEGVISDQIESLPRELKKAVPDTKKLSPLERSILKDADYLECAFQAKEYSDMGNKGTFSWIASIEKRLKTKSAKGLIAQMKKMDSNSWWEGLKKLV